jgi:hypothetical protein
VAGFSRPRPDGDGGRPHQRRTAAFSVTANNQRDERRKNRRRDIELASHACSARWIVSDASYALPGLIVTPATARSSGATYKLVRFAGDQRTVLVDTPQRWLHELRVSPDGAWLGASVREKMLDLRFWPALD